MAYGVEFGLDALKKLDERFAGRGKKKDRPSLSFFWSKRELLGASGFHLGFGFRFHGRGGGFGVSSGFGLGSFGIGLGFGFFGFGISGSFGFGSFGIGGCGFCVRFRIYLGFSLAGFGIGLDFGFRRGGCCRGGRLREDGGGKQACNECSDQFIHWVSFRSRGKE